MDGTGPGHAERVAAYATVGSWLSMFSDRRIRDLVTAAPRLGSGIGGRSAQLEVEGMRVFVKRVPLTDIELRPEHVRSTANLFDLPLFYQYGVGSAGFGAWRELAVHLMTTGWVLKNEYAGFPLLYHWRILPDSPPAGFVDEFGGIEGAVAHWDGSPAVRRRLEAIGRSSFSLVLFLESVPQTLAAWLGAGADAAARSQPGSRSPYRWVENGLSRGTEFMSARGMVHFDAHFANVLTDGRQVYFTDFGLALSRGFELSAEEAHFLADHLVYDRSYAPGHLLRHLLRHLPGAGRDRTEHAAFLREWAEGRRPDGVPPEVGAIIDRHAPHAIILDDFHQRLLTQSKHTPFPAAEVEQALAGADASAFTRTGRVP